MAGAIAAFPSVADSESGLIVYSGDEPSVSRDEWIKDRDRALDTKEAFLEHIEVVTRIRDTKSYKHEYETFDEFCEKVLHMSRDYFNKYGRSLQVRKNLEESLARIPNLPKTIVSRVSAEGPIEIPDTESHLREIGRAPLESQLEVTVMAQTQAKTEGRKVTAKDYRNAVDKIVHSKNRKSAAALPAHGLAESSAPAGANACGDRLGAPLEPPAPIDHETNPLPAECSTQTPELPAAERYVDDHQQEVPESLHLAWRSISRIEELASIISDGEAARATEELISLGQELGSKAMIKAGRRANRRLFQANKFILEAVPAVVAGETFLTRAEVRGQRHVQCEGGEQASGSQGVD